MKRPADFVIGGSDNPYLFRWWLIPRNVVFNVYLHRIVRSDDDRALHDHPWWNLSIILKGAYIEHTIAAGGINRRAVRSAGAIKFRLGKAAHRLELVGVECWTLFITGPRFRAWGFHRPDAGWVHWKNFTASDDKGAIGRGCNQ